MATLAVGQMIYYGLQSLRSLGGDDDPRCGLAGGWNPEAVFGVAIVLIAALAAWLIGRIKRSEMGYFMQAARDDERKLAALGMSPAVRLCICRGSCVCWHWRSLVGTADALYQPTNRPLDDVR